MPRIIVTTDHSEPSTDPDVLLEETVHSVHLDTDHAAAQLVQRLAWAISDAEDAEGAGPDRSARSSRMTSARGSRSSRTRRPIAARTGHLSVSSA
ncbi:MAG: hypothetical protein ACYDHN_13045 [Solirubrobacteraceae bacterium]